MLSEKVKSVKLLDLRDPVPTCLACLRAHVPTCFACLRAYVAMCFACLRVQVSCVLTCPLCLCAVRAYMVTWQRALLALRAHVLMC